LKPAKLGGQVAGGGTVPTGTSACQTTRIAIDSSRALATPRPAKANHAPRYGDGLLTIPVAKALMILVPPSSPSSPATIVRVNGKYRTPSRRREPYAISATFTALPRDKRQQGRKGHRVSQPGGRG
jgi:hypothetical protein